MQVKDDGRKLVDHAIESLMRCVQLVDAALGIEPALRMMSPVQQPQPQMSRPADREEAIRMVPYRRDESQLPSIMRLISAELSEPYSIYTYRYFIHNWPELCYLAEERSTGEYMGVIVCKLDKSQSGYCAGYIAMLAVEMCHRRKGIGTRLVQRAIDAMEKEGCDEVVLETEVSNTSAMCLYSQLGFIREKRLFRYYLNGVDAFRLKLYLTDRTSDCGVGETVIDGRGASRSNDSPLDSQQVMQQPVI